MEKTLKELLTPYFNDLSEAELNHLGLLLDIFMQKNSMINLSAIRDEGGVVLKHFADSLMLNKFLKLEWKILDIWTWWWFPGIPLAITNPKQEFYLLDSTRKKIDAVRYFSEELGLNNVNLIWWRAEEIVKDTSMAKTFDFIVSRATAYMPNILEWAMPFLKPNWAILLYKIENEDEINDWKKFLNSVWFILKDIFRYEIWWQDRLIYMCCRK